MSLAGPGTDSGTFDYFTDEINGEEGASRSDYEASEDDNVHRPGRRGRRGCARLLRLHLLRGEPGHAEGPRGRRRRGLRGAERRDGPGRLLRPALPAALRLREERVAGEARGGCVPPLLLREPGVDRRAGAVHLDGRDDGAGAERTRSRRRSRRRAPRSIVATRDAAVRAQPAIRLRAERRRYGEDLIKILLGLCAARLASRRRSASSRRCSSRRSTSSARSTSSTTSRAPTGRRSSSRQRFGVLPLVVGTLSVTFWACVVCMPFGLGAAIYLSEYASEPRHASG